VNEETGKLIIEATKERDDGRRLLACKRAFDLASENDISLAEIGAYCNENNIKIVGCQLGCFK
jgi:hypothetical protein